MYDQMEVVYLWVKSDVLVGRKKRKFRNINALKASLQLSGYMKYPFVKYRFNDPGHESVYEIVLCFQLAEAEFLFVCKVEMYDDLLQVNDKVETYKYLTDRDEYYRDRILKPKRIGKAKSLKEITDGDSG